MTVNSTTQNLFVLLMTHIKPLNEVDQLIEAHSSYLKRHYGAGNFLVSGRKEPRTGGVILARAENREQIQGIIAEDPLLIAGVSAYEVIEFHPSTYTSGFEQFLL